jgi:membrane fusion protein (multidrug efflux system)
MSSSFTKVLLGALAGALLVGFLWHAMNERARRGPAVAAPPAPATNAARSAAAASAKSGDAVVAPSVDVVAAPARVDQLTLDLEALGNAHANESVEVTAKVSNLVTAVRFAEGQHVGKGAVLIELDGAQARAELAVAEAALGESTSQYKRSRELYSTHVLSQAQAEQIEATFKANQARVAAARARLADTVVRAPFSGRVGLRRVSVGSLVSPGTAITTLDDMSVIKLDFTIPEAQVAAVKTGLQIAAQSPAYPGATFAGRVASVDSRVDPQTRSVTVRALVPNVDGRLKPGMFLNVRMSRGTADGLVVPEEALLPEQGNVFVFVVKDGRVSKRAIKTGQRRVGDVQVIDGLVAGELVVVEGTQKLRDGAAVSVAEAPARQVAQAAGS